MWFKSFLVGAIIFSGGFTTPFFPIQPSQPILKKPVKEPKQERTNKIRKNLGVFEATAYTAYCPGCSGITATGINLRKYPNKKVIAVDPDVIPLGSVVYVEGYGRAIAGDTGGAIDGREIDIFLPSRESALEWGRRQVQVFLIKVPN